MDSQKKLEAFKENGTYQEVSSLMAQLEARTPRRGPAGGMRAPDGKPFAGKPQAPSTEPRSKRTGMAQPIQGDAATVKVAPSTVAVKRTKGGDKGENAPLDAPAVRHASSDPTLTSTNDKAKTEEGKDGEVASKKSGNGSQLGSSAPSSSSQGGVSSSAQSSNGAPTPAAFAANQQPHRLHLNPVPQSPYRGQFVSQAQHQASSSSKSSSSEQQESKGWMDWFVDKLVGSEATTPKWCAFCGAHNGLIPVDELQYARFVCHNCKGYNSPEVLSQLKGMKLSASDSSSSPRGGSEASSPTDRPSSSASSSDASSSAPPSSDSPDEVTPIRERSKPKRQRISQVGTEEEKKD